MTSLDTNLGVTFPALGTSATVVVTDHNALADAEALLRTELAEIDAACSRFRRDSEITWLHDNAGTEVMVSPLLAEAIDVALRAGRVTGGVVDPTVAGAVVGLGYDRDFAELDLDGPTPAAPPRPAPGWWRVSFDPVNRLVQLPRTVGLDLGATAKALAADRAARRIEAAVGGGVLVSLGGDISTAGQAPEGGWRIGVGEDHLVTGVDQDITVTIKSGGLATSSTTCRTWRRAGRTVHHIVDPRTGDVAVRAWRAASVAAASCVDANTASTAAIVLGWSTPSWLTAARLPGRLVGQSGNVLTVAGWPAEDTQG
ncbi:MAG TPA: FAD:protein FMN transferase [Pseudonocardiaceae bacterium]|nr:FAD:protein FMN transferase [Pseudonocardiaceae bacterium]